jgi:hypothetical protein
MTKRMLDRKQDKQGTINKKVNQNDHHLWQKI